VRFLSRLGIFADLGLSVLAAYGFARIWRGWLHNRMPGVLARGALIGALCALIWAENVPRRGTLFARSGRVPGTRSVDRWLARQPRGPVLELPLTSANGLESERQWWQLTHGMPIRNGLNTFFPEGYADDCLLFAVPQSAEAVARLRTLGIRYILLDTDNRYAGRLTLFGEIPRMPGELTRPYVQVFRDVDVIAYMLAPAAANGGSR
jgi:hypothetical protein